MTDNSPRPFFSFVRILLIVVCIGFAATARAQDKPAPSNNAAPPAKFPAAKSLPGTSSAADADASGSAGSPSDKDGPDVIRKRDEWFYKQRASVHGRIPAGARQKAFQHMQRMMAAEGKLEQRPDGSYAAVTPQVTTPAWTSIGPTPTTGGTFSPVTGRITTIAVDPSDSTGSTVLIGGAQGGIWRSTDAGSTWTAVGDQNASLAMGSVAFAPSSPSTVYAGTGEQASLGFDIYYGAGVLKSTDSGRTWTQTCTVASATCPFIGPYIDGLDPGFGFLNFGGARISYVAVNPSNPNLLLVAAQFLVEGPQEGIYCSSNGGQTWTNILPDEMATFVGFASSTVAFAALGNPFGSSPGAPHGNGIYKSTNANSCSAAFTPLSGGLPTQTSMGRMDLGISPNYSSDNTVYASIADASQGSNTNLGVWVTNSGGTSWSQTSAPDVCQQQCWYDNVIKVDPSNKNDVYFGGSAVTDINGNPQWVMRSTNGGSTWSTVIPNQLGTGLPHVDTHAIAFVKTSSGVRVYLGNDGGIWRTDNAEATPITWLNLNNSSLTLTQFYPTISIHTSTPSIAFGGTQDNSSQQLATSPSWVVNTGTFQGPTGPVQSEVCGDGTSTAIDPQIPSTVYISCQFTSVNASYQTGAAGSFFPAVTGIDPTEPTGFVPALVADPNQANVAYFATTRLYQTLDAAQTWTPISSTIAGGQAVVTTIAVGASDSSTIYLGFNTGVISVATGFTTGTLANFVDPSTSPLPPRGITAISIDPSDTSGQTAYAAFSGFAFVGPDPLNPQASISDPLGHVFKTTDAGRVWADVSCSMPDCSKPAAADLPNIPVNDIVVDPDLPGTIYAATDLGVFVGSCTTTPCSWSTLGVGLPHVAVLSLRLHEPSRTLRAATHGRGMWDLALNNFAFSGPHISSLAPTSANSGGASSVALTVNGSGLTGGTVSFAGAAIATVVVSDSQLTATIPANSLVAGSQKVTVTTGTAPNLTTSNALPFEVIAQTPTVASCTSSVPASTAASCGTPVQANPATSVQLTITGTNLATGAKTLFDGSYAGISSQTNSTTKLTATLPPALLGPFGSTNDISVLNTPPGGGKSLPLTLQVVAPPPANNTFANATAQAGLMLGGIEDSSGALADPAAPTPPCANQFTNAQGNTGGHPNGTYNTVWFQYTTPAFAANLELDTLGSSYDTVLSVWSSNAGSLTNLACNDDIQPGVQVQSQISGLPLTANTTYYILVSSFGPPDPNPIALGGKMQLNGAYNGGLNPMPTINSLSPNSTPSGGASFTLIVNGGPFLNGATVFFNNVQEQTTFVSSTQLTATISPSDIVLPGTYGVVVANPAPSDTSFSFNFTVTVGTYPVPTLVSISPTTAVAGSVPFALGAVCSECANGAVINFNGAAKPTTFINSGGIPPQQLISTLLSPADVSTPGTVQVSVSNPSPGGGPSSPLPFIITQPTVVPTITSVNPSSFPAGTPTTITVTGTGFLPGVALFITNFGYVYPGASATSTQFSISNLSIGGPGIYAIYVVDPAPAGASAPFSLTLTGPPDFSFTVASGQSTQTVTAGQTATFTNVITVNAMNGFTGQVAVSCTSPAQATSCSVTPPSLNAGQSASVQVTTTARGLTPPALRNRPTILWPRLLPITALVMLICLLLARLAQTRRQRLVAAVPLAGIVLFVVLQAIGCGGGSSTPPPPPPPTGTPAGNYTITVTGTSGNLTHTTTLTLVVN